MDGIKAFTIMLYQNGNNELCKETWQTFLDINQNVINIENINVVLQISLENKENLKIMRPLLNFDENDEFFEETRRYYFKKGKFRLFDTLGNINMADPKSLYDFIIWSSINYPAKKYILCFGGHVYQFVGLLCDYSQDKPYIASFPQIAYAIEKACKESHITIDILILDTCYSSTFEVIYEFGKSNDQYIKYLLTYIEKGPLGGLIYSKLINTINEHYLIDTNDLLKKLILSLCNNDSISLIAYKLDYKILSIFKKLFNNIAYTYMLYEEKLDEKLTPYELLSTLKKEYPWFCFLNFIFKLIDILIIYKKENDDSRKNLLPIHVLYTKIPDTYRKELYKNLSFCKDNFWYNLICNISINNLIEYENLSLEPIEIPENIFYTFISTTNSNLSEEENREIVKTISEKKKWKLKELY